ncbi:MAG: polymerase subunit beta, polymerase subunit beta protein [Candidatus Paceibacter sp.]|jgi:DNA polymerase-3 subunit beta|nr:polymerase subunit beta, polymerase subunit beta protein [Candidatus Paceibacter sp.]
MKIECVKSKLAEAVAKSEKVTGKNLTLPVLSCILIEAEGHDAIIRATNLDLGIEITVPVKVHEKGKVAIPGGVLNSFLAQSANDKNVTIESSEGNVKVTGDTGTTVIKSQNSDDFPTIPRITGEKIYKVSAKELIRGIKAVWYASATSSMKPELSSVYIYADDDGLIFVSTDSFRLAEKKVKMKGLKDFEPILIPVKNIPEIMRVLEKAEGEVDMVVTKNQISFSYNGVYLTSRVVDGIFPDYKQIIPKDFKTTATVLKGDVVSALKIATIFSDKFNKLSVKVHPSEKTFEFATRNADIGESVNKIEAVLEGDDLDINFNYRYITDSFQSLEADSLVFGFNGLARALIIRGIGDNSFTYLVMPINK